MTKPPRTFVLRYIPCGCHLRKGCFNCQFTGYRTEHVPLADAILEVEEQNAAAYLESVKQEGLSKRAPCFYCGCTDFWIPHKGAPYCCVKCNRPEDTSDASPTVGKEPVLPQPRDGAICYSIVPNASPDTSEKCLKCGHYDFWEIADNGMVLCHACGAPFRQPSGTPALLTPHSARQSGTQVGDQPYSDAEKGAEGDAGPEKEQLSGCPECGCLTFQSTTGMPDSAQFLSDGVLFNALDYDFACEACGFTVGSLPLGEQADNPAK